LGLGKCVLINADGIWALNYKLAIVGSSDLEQRNYRSGVREEQVSVGNFSVPALTQITAEFPYTYILGTTSAVQATGHKGPLTG
jgi:hypothetical protein